MCAPNGKYDPSAGICNCRDGYVAASKPTIGCHKEMIIQCPSSVRLSTHIIPLPDGWMDVGSWSSPISPTSVSIQSNGVLWCSYTYTVPAWDALSKLAPDGYSCEADTSKMQFRCKKGSDETIIQCPSSAHFVTNVQPLPAGWMDVVMGRAAMPTRSTKSTLNNFLWCEYSSSDNKTDTLAKSAPVGYSCEADTIKMQFRCY